MTPKQQLLAIASSVLMATSAVDAFAGVHVPQEVACRTRTTTALGMGLFDGVKEAFSAPALERSAIDAERETPIDRWMGWSVVSENQQQQPKAGVAGTFFHDRRCRIRMRDESPLRFS